MARPVSVAKFQAAQRGEETTDPSPGFRSPALTVAEQLRELVLTDDIAGMPLGQVVGLVRMATKAAFVNATESEIRDEAERRHQEYVESVEPSAEDEADQDWEDGPTAEEVESFADHLLGLNGAAQFSAEMSLHMITERIREGVQALPERFRAEVTEADIVAEAEEIWEGFSDNRKGPREVVVNGDGTVAGVRLAEMTPDRGPDVGTTVHQVSEDQRFSGGGAEVQGELLFAIPGAAKFGTSTYLAAPALEEIAARLIYTKPDFEPLDGLRIVYRWKAKGGNSKGWPLLGGIERVRGQALAFIHGQAPDLMVWLAADTLRESAVTELQVEAILFDQLASVEWSDGDEDGDPTWRLVGPEIVCHMATLEAYGPFTRKLKAAQPAFAQPGLFDAAPDVARDDGAGVLIHEDGTPLTADEIADLEAHELADDDLADPDQDYEDEDEDERPDLLAKYRVSDAAEASRNDSDDDLADLPL